MAVFQGTANVTNNSANVTNVTGFTLSPLSVFPGAMVSLNGISYILQSVTNTTSFVLNRPYFGTTATGVRLDINTISESETEIVTLNARTADLIEDLLTFDPNNNLSSMSALTGSGAIMQNSTGNHSLITVTPFARTLLDDANAAAARATLGAGDVTGPASVVGDTVPLYQGSTGKILKEGFPVTGFMRGFLNSATAAIGRVTLGTNDIANLTTGILPLARGGTGGTTEAVMKGIYTGSALGNLDFPVGEIVVALGGAQRNQSATVRLDPADDNGFTLTGTGGILTGTWRARGHAYFGTPARIYTLMRRVA